MKIEKIEAIPLMVQLAKPVKMPRATVGKFYATIVRITTDDGVIGAGECIVRANPRTTQTIIEELLSPIVLGRDPRDVEGIWWDMFNTLRTRGHSRGFLLEAMAGVDIALWDILGRYAKVPIGKLLGGYDRKRVSVYASSIMLNEIAHMEKEAADLVEKGFKAIKIKVGLGLEQDTRIVRSIRRVVGDRIELMVDANSFYSAGEAIQAGRVFEDVGILWFEEPVPPDDVRGYKQIRDKLDLGIAAGESEFTVYDFRRLLEENCVDIVQPDVTRAGGITESRKIANLAQAFNKYFAPHTGFSSSVCVFAALQLAAYAPNFSQYEYMYIDNPLQHILNIPKPSVIDGIIDIPQGFGLGAELDEAAISKYRMN